MCGLFHNEYTCFLYVTSTHPSRSSYFVTVCSLFVYYILESGHCKFGKLCIYYDPLIFIPSLALLHMPFGLFASRGCFKLLHVCVCVIRYKSYNMHDQIRNCARDEHNVHAIRVRHTRSQYARGFAIHAMSARDIHTINLHDINVCSIR